MTILKCKFKNNTAKKGGALYIVGNSSNLSAYYTNNLIKGSNDLNYLNSS